jgi:hypothetical protein
VSTNPPGRDVASDKIVPAKFVVNSIAAAGRVREDRLPSEERHELLPWRRHRRHVHRLRGG